MSFIPLILLRRAKNVKMQLNPIVMKIITCNARTLLSKISILSCYNEARVLHLIISIITNRIQLFFDIFRYIQNVRGTKKIGPWLSKYENVKDIFYYIWIKKMLNLIKKNGKVSAKNLRLLRTWLIGGTSSSSSSDDITKDGLCFSHIFLSSSSPKTSFFNCKG